MYNFKPPAQRSPPGKFPQRRPRGIILQNDMIEAILDRKRSTLKDRYQLFPADSNNKREVSIARRPAIETVKGIRQYAEIKRLNDVTVASWSDDKKLKYPGKQDIKSLLNNPVIGGDPTTAPRFGSTPYRSTDFASTLPASAQLFTVPRWHGNRRYRTGRRKKMTMSQEKMNRAMLPGHHSVPSHPLMPKPRPLIISSCHTSPLKKLSTDPLRRRLAREHALMSRRGG